MRRWDSRLVNEPTASADTVIKKTVTVSAFARAAWSVRLEHASETLHVS